LYIAVHNIMAGGCFTVFTSLQFLTASLAICYMACLQTVGE